MSNQPTQPLRRRDKIVAVACGLCVAGMVGAAYAAVPFYNWFCKVTGFNGTTQVAIAAPASGTISDEQRSVEVRIGEVVTVNYLAINETARQITASAAYNVTPLTMGSYFQKINCFCFTEQTLKAGEKREMAVVFYVDPAMLQDSDSADTNTITLSYTFYPQREPQRPVADGAPPARPKS
jgi:cytochrome c oxidase assembly protein subunit 11